MKFRTIIAILFLLIPIFCVGQNPFLEGKKLKLDHLTVNNGLSQSSVLSILQDSRGLMWFGTRDGLNLYNGYTFNTFRHEQNDSLSLSGNYINSLAEDEHGNVWVATDKGLSCYLRESGHFQNFYTPTGGHTQLIGETDLRAIVIDKNKMLWAGSSHGVFGFDIESKKFLSPDSSAVSSIDHSTTSLYIDRNNILWVGTARHGVFEVSADRTHATTHASTFLNQQGGSVIRIEAIHEDEEENIWIGTYGNGLYILGPDRSLLHHITTQSTPFRIPNNNIRSLLSDKIGNIWIGTFDGLAVKPKDSNIARHLVYEEGTPDGLSHSSIRSLFCDNKGTVWIGTYFGGINIFDSDNQRFEHHYHIPSSPHSLSYDVVGAFAKDTQGNLLIGTERGGINIYHADTKKYKHLIHEPDNKQSLSDNTIKSLFTDKKGIIWAGIFRGGLNRIEPSYNQITRYPNQQPEFSGLEKSIVNCIVQDSLSNLWLATDDAGGLQKFNPANGKFINYPFRKELAMALGSAPVKNIWQDHEGNLWLATRGKGLLVFHEKKGIIDHYTEANSSLPSNDLNTTFQSSDDMYWIATQGEGVVSLDPKTKQFASITSDQGLLNNIVLGISQDEAGYLWFSTISGLSRFHITSESFQNYSHASGFPLQEINEGAFFTASKNEFLIGGSNGYVRLQPDQVQNNEFVPPVVLTDMLIYNKRVIPGDETGALAKEIGESEEIVLDWHQSVFTLEFAALSYLRSGQNQYQYKLNGFDDEWIEAGNKRSVTYTNLRDGKYTFQIKGSNNDGKWNETPTSLIIHVLPPPWRTWWAFVGYAAVIFIGFLLIRYNAIKSAQLKNDLRWEQVEKERMQEMHRLKLQYFTDVSHEFRTPLTLIVNPLEELIQSNEGSSWHQKQLRLMYYNCRRMLLLIDQVLEMREVETGHAKIHTVPTSVVKVIGNVVDSFHGLADHRSIRLRFHAIESEGLFATDVDKVEKIFFNLLSNAFKFTNDGGEIRVDVRSKKEKDKSWFVCKVSDTGRGIAKEHIDKVFDRFYKQGKNTGSGIGLSLTHSLVSLLGGEISVQSKPGEGTTFTLRIPFTPATLNPSEAGSSSPSIKPLPIEYQTYLAHQKLDSPKSNHDSTTILVVEDNKDLRLYLKTHLRKKYTVITARNGERGLSKAKKFGPQLIISDVMMDVMDGIELCRQVKTDIKLSHIPVILLTAKGTDTDRIHGLEEGADDYLIKPFIMHELEVRITNLLANRQRVHDLYKSNKTYSPKEVTVTSFDEKLMVKIMAVIEEKMNDPSLGVEFLGKEIGLSRVHLFRKLKALTGLAPVDFIRNIRLKRAAQLLKQDLKISEVAYQVGFQDVNYFSKCFKKIYQMSPSEFIQKQKLGQS